ncbi:DNA-binding NarL/FixJ family response regulator [Actinoplanes lutulentus]|uniref:DNA-binding NarL/FixJ family response regulator n=1 Tax=Actinoplanes lutulentus TaxID=1287878 RepID=A0A327Z7S2_9ACTN|nr:response regulator transcription factor [Actinoplanes lutulentus]MBB2948503.1 DNA-binding NarL/FixJ family response regulator [Actinoplanes lutulentus]RAK34465.1 DNA-binding NarL/FixJ family response regulator [Actinoplanes lutulentus]
MRVAILGQVRLFRESIRAALAQLSQVTVLGDASPDAAGMTRIRRLGPDVVLVDVTPAGVRDSLRALTTGLPGIRTVAIGVPDSDDDVIACLEAGAAACVHRDGDLSQLVETLRQVAAGAVVCSPSITGGLFRRLAVLADQQRGVTPATPLTSREQEIAALLADGLSNRQISRRLFIEVSTVKNHVHNILEKLRLSGRSHAASWYEAQRR